MATKEELHKAIRLIRETCAETYNYENAGCSDCVLCDYCVNSNGFGVPCEDWPDPEEGDETDANS